MNEPGQPLLSIRNVVVEYPALGPRGKAFTAVRGVSLDIPPAAVLALVGESGSGKTSLARAILQLQPALSGEMLFHGTNLAQMRKPELRRARKSIQAIFQDPQASLSPRRTIGQTLLEPLDHFRIGAGAERMERVDEALEAVGLDPRYRERYPRELSGGQRQRVALARALVAEPELIIADEPVSSLDVTVQSRIIELILELRESRGIAFLFVSHDLSVVRQLADSIAVMYLGKLLETAPAEQLFSNPAHPYTRSLLAAVPVADPDHPAPRVLGGESPSALTPPAGCVFHMRCAEKLDRCLAEDPVEREVGTGAFKHRVKCHLWNS